MAQRLCYFAQWMEFNNNRFVSLSPNHRVFRVLGFLSSRQNAPPPPVPGGGGGTFACERRGGGSQFGHFSIYARYSIITLRSKQYVLYNMQYACIIYKTVWVCEI